jgi:thymidylate kinase
MPQLSPHYKNDDPTQLDQDTKNYLDKEYLGKLDNIHQPNPKLLVVFSGGNAMGKSTLSKKIGDRLEALVLENDAIKRCLLQRTPSLGMEELNQLTWSYTMDLYQRLEHITPNGFIVRDGIIDWYYDRILPVFQKAGYPLFIIGFDVTRQKAIELIKRRGDTPTIKEERFYKILDDHEIHMRRFRKLYKPDITLTDATIFNHDRVLNSLADYANKLKK